MGSCLALNHTFVPPLEELSRTGPDLSALPEDVARNKPVDLFCHGQVWFYKGTALDEILGATQIPCLRSRCLRITTWGDNKACFGTVIPSLQAG